MELLELSAYIMLIVLVSFYVIANWVNHLCYKDAGKYQICASVIKNESGTEDKRTGKDAWLLESAPDVPSGGTGQGEQGAR